MQSLEDLIDPITEATVGGDLTWEEEPTISNGFAVVVGAYRVATWRWTDENDGSSGITVSLRNKGTFGTALDTIVANEYSPRYERLAQFFNLARRSALNVDSIVSALKKDLKALRSR